MTAVTIDELKREALSLDPASRASLAHELIASLDELSEAEVEQQWLEEAERRREEIVSGKVQGVPASEVFRKARAARS